MSAYIYDDQIKFPNLIHHRFWNDLNLAKLSWMLRARRNISDLYTVNPHLVAFILIILKVLCLFLTRKGLFIVFFTEQLFIVVTGTNSTQVCFLKSTLRKNLFPDYFTDRCIKTFLDKIFIVRCCYYGTYKRA